MQAHPVPKNIIEVEFKLFGAFSLRQFSKIIIGCLIALLIFLLPGTIFPWFIKFPLMALSVILGIGMAIVQNLGIWLSTFAKAIFISPRYVWKKQTVAPDTLRFKQKKDFERQQLVSSSKSATRKVDLTQISLSKLLATRGGKYAVQDENVLDNEAITDQSQRQMADVRGQNFQRAFGEVFQEQQSIPPQPIPIVVTQQAPQAPEPKILRTVQDYTSEIDQLKSKLVDMAYEDNDEEQEKEVMDRITSLTQQLRLLQDQSNIQGPQAQQSKVITDMQGNKIGEVKQNVFGVLVDKNNKPVSEAKIHLTEVTSGVGETIQSIADGRFVTTEPLVAGTYDVIIEHPTIKFHTYRISVGNEKLPAYRFRER